MEWRTFYLLNPFLPPRSPSLSLSPLPLWLQQIILVCPHTQIFTFSFLLPLFQHVDYFFSRELLWKVCTSIHSTISLLLTFPLISPCFYFIIGLYRTVSMHFLYSYLLIYVLISYIFSSFNLIFLFISLSISLFFSLLYLALLFIICTMAMAHTAITHEKCA